MSLDKLSDQLSSNTKLPPVELWDPPYCGEINLVIKADGNWFYNGTIFKRMALVKLFASVLKREGEDYFLVTPVEKVKIIVEDAPFLLTQWQWTNNNHITISASTNLDDYFEINSEHPVVINESGELYVTVRRNLLAKVHRNVYYQWANIAQESSTNDGTELVLTSSGYTFSLGKID
ncbi:DUF1285 domain-containing protein [Thalassotalea profundi]|uniref:DUF1285 domain-containing protein n=1 Tax=Thalassotalea profundi TaxID=2036687 RepID=A0ABQ3IS54_9GAMM|nr:DUF1285 domain-containing protein [Thalassotalea profundi]GHE88361.1 hypothetical protein GCM10011501_17210 [Thalassotalea profundi]